jgi:hypothetical protein
MLATGDIDAPAGPYVETYYSAGKWYARRNDSEQAFASSSLREWSIAVAAEVARWNHIPHVIRDTDGNIVEIDVYGTGPYPHRSPLRRVRRTD